jgi:hypothetical protein
MIGDNGKAKMAACVGTVFGIFKDDSEPTGSHTCFPLK